MTSLNPTLFQSHLERLFNHWKKVRGINKYFRGNLFFIPRSYFEIIIKLKEKLKF